MNNRAPLHAKRIPRRGDYEELAIFNARQWLLGLVAPRPPRPVWNGRDRHHIPAQTELAEKAVA